MDTHAHYSRLKLTFLSGERDGRLADRFYEAQVIPSRTFRARKSDRLIPLWNARAPRELPA